jgi:hypothetical protein
MTQWINDPVGGRDRGPAGLIRAWVEVLIRPRRFFRNGISPGDQAPGLIFVGLVVLLEEGSRVAAVTASARDLISTGAVSYPVIGTLAPLELALVVVAIVVFVTPATLHLVAALQTVLLSPFAPDRGGVSQTVQVVAYATAPCVVAGLPSPRLRVVCALWGAILYVVGTSEIHSISLARAAALGLIPATIVFGYGFRGVAAIQLLI